MNNSDRKALYFLRRIDGWYERVEHHVDEPEGRCGLCFRVNEDTVSDGDGFPVSYNKHDVQIDEKEYLHVIDLFRKAGDAMCVPCEKAGKPLDRQHCLMRSFWHSVLLKADTMRFARKYHKRSFAATFHLRTEANAGNYALIDANHVKSV